MNKFILAMALAITSFVGVGFAQTPASETYVGAQYTRVNPDVREPNFRFDDSSDSLGGVISITDYKTQNIGLTAEGSAVFNTGNTPNQLYTGMGGLTYKIRKHDKVQPFGKVVGGFAVLRVGDTVFGPSRTNADIAFKVSTGVDYGTGNVKFRIFEVGYLQTRFYNQRQDNFVVSTGVIF